MSTSKLFTPGTEFGTVPASSSAGKKLTLLKPSSRPLAPSVSVSSSSSGDSREIVLSCVVLISEENMPKNGNDIDFGTPINFQVNGLVTDVNKISIYISNGGSFIPSKNFYPFVVNIQFKPSQVSHLNNNFNSIKVINWDADPEGSRGTETTVKDPMGG
ncbi:hypothetical protein [Tenacibaculum halocynthiae]|uniref:hypothetical protein n=1 Tax=Tenacibaculum halocynthiae TaxID=1254437 RepID=UPI003892F6CE